MDDRARFLGIRLGPDPLGNPVGTHFWGQRRSVDPQQVIAATFE